MALDQTAAWIIKGKNNEMIRARLKGGRRGFSSWTVLVVEEESTRLSDKNVQKRRKKQSNFFHGYVPFRRDPYWKEIGT